MRLFSRTRIKTAFVVCATLIVLTTNLRRAIAQVNWVPTSPVGTNTGVVGIQTGPLPSANCNDLLNINGIPSTSASPWRPGVRLFYGGTAATLFGDLAIQRTPETYLPITDRQLCALAMDRDLILRTEFDPANTVGMGDLLISSQGGGKAIRLCTTPTLSAGDCLDVERMTVAGNGNVGIDLPHPGMKVNTVPTVLADPCLPDPNLNLHDQVEIGGGLLPWTQQSFGAPGLTIFGGNVDEGAPIPGKPGETFPQDWRYIGFNSYINHLDNTGCRFKPIVPGMGSSRMTFAPGPGWENNTGLIALEAHLGDQSGNGATNGTELELTGNQLTFFTGRVNGTTASPFYSVFYAHRPEGTTAND